MRKQETTKFLYHSYSTLEEMQKLAIPEQNQDKAGSVRDNEAGESWYGIGSGTCSSIMKKIRRGWPEATKRAKTELGALIKNVPKIKSVRRRRRFADQGDSLDIHKVYQGNIDRAWQRTYREAGHALGGQHVTLVVDMATSANVKSNEAFWRGAVVTLLVDVLQESGRSVQLIAAASVNNLAWDRTENKQAKKPFVTSLILKRFDQQMSLSNVMATAGNIGFFRTFIFLALCRAPYQVASGLGQPLGRLPDGIKVEGASENDVIQVPCHILSKQAAESFIDKTLTRFMPSMS